MADKPTMNTAEAAPYLGVSTHTLEQWRWLGKGPAYMKIGRRVVYRVSDLDAWMDSLIVRPAATA